MFSSTMAIKMKKPKNNEYEISDYNYIGSAIGNAFHSGLTFEEFWHCVYMSKTREELDFAVTATIDFKKIVKRN
jgi:hypothetical protein